MSRNIEIGLNLNRVRTYLNSREPYLSQTRRDFERPRLLIKKVGTRATDVVALGASCAVGAFGTGLSGGSCGATCTGLSGSRRSLPTGPTGSAGGTGTPGPAKTARPAEATGTEFVHLVHV